jgi:hypothetical protein
VKTRTSAQIRSHAQKYVIKLCRKYCVIPKSKKSKDSQDSDESSLRNSGKQTIKRKFNIDEIPENDRKILMIFNYSRIEFMSAERGNHDFGDHDSDKFINTDNSDNFAKNSLKRSKTLNRKKKKFKLLKKNIPKKSFFKIEKSTTLDSDTPMLENFHQNVIYLINENEKVFQSLQNSNTVQENISLITTFLDESPYKNIYHSTIFNFDLPSFMNKMDGILNMWNTHRVINNEIPITEIK